MEDIKVTSDGETSALNVKATTDASEGDLEFLGPAPSQTAIGNTSSNVKEEEETELTKLDKRITALTEDPRKAFDEFTSIQVEATQILQNSQASSSANSYHAPLIKDVLDHIPKVERVCGLLHKLLTASPQPDEMPKLISAIDQVKIKHTEILSWAQRFGLAPFSKSKYVKRRKLTETARTRA